MLSVWVSVVGDLPRVTQRLLLTGHTLFLLSCRWLARARGWLVYHWQPFDLSIWGKLRSPGWWLLQLIAAVPLYTAQVAFHFIMFMLMDKGDEFQLCRLVVQFKGLQFVALGVVSATIGYVQYFACVSPPVTGQPWDLQHGDCHIHGPGSNRYIYYDSIAFLVQVPMALAGRHWYRHRCECLFSCCSPRIPLHSDCDRLGIHATAAVCSTPRGPTQGRPSRAGTGSTVALLPSAGPREGLVEMVVVRFLPRSLAPHR